MGSDKAFSSNKIKAYQFHHSLWLDLLVRRFQLLLPLPLVVHLLSFILLLLLLFSSTFV